ncbi:hypothetical protein [Rhodoferax sp.]|uniref:hypothetical protein n=1 Tax=Rhodoferax sp. TaxID=50421 RepID=UPI00274DAD1D|nr:hypothetical protein [Rhodoferax sp.]
MDPSQRYNDLRLQEAELIKPDQHLLAAPKTKPKAGHVYLEATVHCAAKACTGTITETKNHGC